jgi:hypothetical protein
VELGRDEVHEVVLDGFFPEVGLDQPPDRRRSGVVEFGLPYAADPAITRHLAGFLGQHRQAAAEALGPAEPPVPDALLLNGGVFRSALLARRVAAQLSAWRGGPVRLLENARPDLAVALGAVAYGRARRGHAIQRIGGGSARSYFLVVETGQDRPDRGVCILPRGTPEGEEVVLAERSFLLKLGTPVRFHLVASTDDFRPVPGALADLDEERFLPLPPLAAALDRESGKGEQAVRIAAILTEVGTLSLSCVAEDDPDRRWRIEFQLRGAAPALAGEGGAPRHSRLDEALDRIREIFGKKARTADPKAIKGLRNDLERMLGPRERWDTALLRELFGGFLEGLPHRRRSADHERVWLSLSGYCLRPGFGYPLDDWRVKQLFAVYGAGLQFVNEPQNWAEWWTLWRRVAGGLSAEAQATVFQDLADFLDPDRAKRGNLPALAKKRGYEDMVRLAAVLERLPAATKAELGGWLLRRLAKPGEPAESWWALGRIGARVPFHGSAHNTVPRPVAATWLDAALARDLKKEPHPGFAAALLARLSGDRERDLEVERRALVVERFRASRVPESWIAMVSEVKDLTESDEKRIFGEALPPGLVLID